MANLNIGEAAALSPAMNFDLTTPVMKGINLGMQEKAAEAKALAARLKKNKILSLDTSNIHPTLRGDAEKLAYETTAQMKMAADAGEDPMSYKNLGQQKINEIQSESKRRFDLEKANPNDYVMDQEAMTLFSQGKSKEAKDLLEKKGYDPQLIAAINPETTLFLPKNVNIQSEIDKRYGYANNPGLYRPAEIENVGGFNKKRQIMRMTDQAANAAAMEMAGNTDVQAKILKDFPTQFKTSLSKVMLNNPGIDPNVARGKAFVDVIKDENNALLPTAKIEDEPKKDFNFNINTGGGDDNNAAGGVTTRRMHFMGSYGLGSYQTSKEFQVDSKVFSFNPQKVGMPTADLVPTSGKSNTNDVGGKTFESGYVTSLPINGGDTDLIIKVKGREFARIKPGQVVDPSYINAIQNNRDKIIFKPVALYMEKVDASGAKATKSYYAEVGPADTNIFTDSEVRGGQQARVLRELQAHSEAENKKYGIGPYAGQARKSSSAPKSSGGYKANTGKTPGR